MLLAYAKITLRAQLLDSPIPEDPWFAAQRCADYFPAGAGRPLRRPARPATRCAGRSSRPRWSTTSSTAAASPSCSAPARRPARRRPRSCGRTPSRARSSASRRCGPRSRRSTAWCRPPRRPLVLLEGRRLLDRTRALAAAVAPLEHRRRRRGRALPARRCASSPRASRTCSSAVEAAAAAPAGPADLVARRAAGRAGAAHRLPARRLLACSTSSRSPPRPAARWTRSRGVYFALSDHYEIDRLLTPISGLPRTDRWQSLARSSLRYDLYAALAGLTADVLRGAPSGTPPRTPSRGGSATTRRA